MKDLLGVVRCFLRLAIVDFVGFLSSMTLVKPEGRLGQYFPNDVLCYVIVLLPAAPYNLG